MKGGSRKSRDRVSILVLLSCGDASPREGWMPLAPDGDP
jgi:hypothetical protein